ncbi:MaoC/PaaZ C-terminal domain-containing protein [Streptomyces sp. NPDC047315]|uniref:MaoC/PaaZ C-terminal domain-containing protein n=1 Tax=Streptomyces sp. NPDC047315 TaxID=3155142 RepID=UPI0033E3A732
MTTTTPDTDGSRDDSHHDSHHGARDSPRRDPGPGVDSVPDSGVDPGPDLDPAPLRPGDELAPLEIPVTRTLIVSGAIASRDYQDVHHDAELARRKGSPDIFMNILTTNGLVGRYVTDRIGPRAVLRKVAIRLGAPNYPGDTMVLRGTVTSIRDDDGGGDGGGGRSKDGRSGESGGSVAEIRITGANGIGTHVTGTVTVTLPASAAPAALPAPAARADPTDPGTSATHSPCEKEGPR